MSTIVAESSSMEDACSVAPSERDWAALLTCSDPAFTCSAEFLISFIVLSETSSRLVKSIGHFFSLPKTVAVSTSVYLYPLASITYLLDWLPLLFLFPPVLFPLELSFTITLAVLVTYLSVSTLYEYLTQ